jgi:mannose-1-phosphate guanylyltransferase/mannose-6-phosphate isomerase
MEAQLLAVECRPNLIITEPVGRNTAPAVAAAAMSLEENQVLLVMPADHMITRPESLVEILPDAVSAAESGRLVTFGVRPSRPETGFGYIEPGDLEQGESEGSWFRVRRFVEKPNPATAAAFLAGGRHYWNSGMFAFRADIITAEISRHAHAISTAVRSALHRAHTSANRIDLGDEFETAPAVSLDKAVMEHTDRAVMLPLESGWSDLGSWQSLYEVGEEDDSGNVIVGDVVASNVSGSYLRSQGRLLVVNDVADLVVVETPDAILVTSRRGSQDLKEIVERLAGRAEV